MKRIQLEDLSRIARDVLERLPAAKDTATLLALRGDLGAGKTTFVQAFAKELGVAATVQSPTYVLMKKYAIAYKRFTSLVHIDAYRLEKPEEFAALNPAEFLNDPGVLVLVEWPERLGGAVPRADLTVNFSSQDAGEGERYIEVV